MPNSVLSADADFPTFTGRESVEERIVALQDYIYTLSEQLRYTLSNLSAANFNSAGLSRLSGAMANGSISADKVDLDGAVSLQDLGSDVVGAINSAGSAAQAAARAAGSAETMARQIADGEYQNGAFLQNRTLKEPEISGEHLTVKGGEIALNGAQVRAQGGSLEMSDTEISGAAFTGPVELRAGDGGAAVTVEAAGGRLRVAGAGWAWLLDAEGWTKEETAP